MGPLRAAAAPYWSRTGVSIEWSVRTLQAFGDQPVEELTPAFDLVSIDHPFVGSAHVLGCLAPLDDLLADEVIADLAADAIGASHVAYEWGGHLWGLATDAACQVAAVRDDLLREAAAPETWDEVLSLARAQPGGVAIPLVPADAISSFLSLCANAGAPPPASDTRFVDEGVADHALAVLEQLVAHGHPESLTFNPPAVFDRMTSSDEIVYVPLAFGYCSYARSDRPAPRLRFLDIPSAGAGPAGSILGGAGLAVSSSSPLAADAAAFAAWISGAAAQRDIVAPAGGQPGSGSAWSDADLDAAVGGFFSATRRTIEAAYVRPRDRWWPEFQLRAGTILHDHLARGDARSSAIAQLERLYLELAR